MRPEASTWAALRHRIGTRPVVGITGSYAKTSTKTLLSRGLEPQMEVACNISSYNVLDGLLSTLQRVEQTTEVVVQEVGASGPGTLDGLLLKLLPTVGVLTAVRDDHLFAFKNREAVLKEKFKIVRALPADGTAVLNIDDALIAGMVDRVHCKVRTFGRAEGADLRAVNVSASWPDRLEFDLEAHGGHHRVKTRLIGEHSLTCVLGAIAAADALGADLPAFIRHVGTIEPLNGRMQEHRRADGLPIIMDNLKAAYYMMEERIAFLNSARARNRYLVVGQMSDTKKKEGRMMRSLANDCREADVSLITIGEMRRRMLRKEEFGFNAGVGVFESVLELFDFMNGTMSADDLVLIKTNITSGLERVVLAEQSVVRCRAVACGRRLSCARCEELGNDNPPEYRFDGSRRSTDSRSRTPPDSSA